jgi:hypothetical protein
MEENQYKPINDTQKGEIENTVAGRISFFIEAMGPQNTKSSQAILKKILEIKDDSRIKNNEKYNKWLGFRTKTIIPNIGKYEFTLEALDDIAHFIFGEKHKFFDQVSSKQIHGYAEDEMMPNVKDYISNFTANKIRDYLEISQKYDLSKELEIKQKLIESRLKELEEKEKSIDEKIKELNQIQSNKLPKSKISSPFFEKILSEKSVLNNKNKENFNKSF